MKTMQKTLALLLSLCLLIGLAASCFASPGEESPSPGGGASPSSGGANPSGDGSGFNPNLNEEEEKADDDDVMVLPPLDVAGKSAVVMSTLDPASDGVLRIIEKYKRLYGADLVFEQPAWDMFSENLAQKILSGDPPDMVMARDSDYPMWAGMGYLRPLDDYIDLDSALWKTVKNTMNNMRYNGKLFAAVRSTTAYYFVWYNKDILANYGLEDPQELFDKGEWTYAKLLEYAIEMTDTTGDTPVYGLAGAFYTLIYCMIDSVQRSPMANDGGNYILTLDDPLLTEVINAFSDLYQKYNVVGPDNYMPEFTQGKIAMMAEGSWTGGTEPLATMHREGTAAMVMWPKWNESMDYSMSGGVGFSCVPHNVKDIELSMSIINSMRFAEPGEADESKQQYIDLGWTDWEWDHMRDANDKVYVQLQKLISDPGGAFLGMMYNMRSNSWVNSRADFEGRCQQVLDEFNALMAAG